MCVIVGYIGERDSVPIILDSLARLEYRGYDSAGIAVIDGSGSLSGTKAEGKLQRLAERLRNGGRISGRVGVGHPQLRSKAGPALVNRDGMAPDRDVRVVRDIRKMQGVFDPPDRAHGVPRADKIRCAWHPRHRRAKVIGEPEVLVHGLLPKRLAAMLQDHLNKYRPLLVTGNDPGTLFVNRYCRPFSSRGILSRVENLTAHYVGRPINPHLFRDIFAVKYLDERPEDYLTLSKILWHRSVATTIQKYGRNFDESHGARRSDSLA